MISNWFIDNKIFQQNTKCFEFQTTDFMKRWEEKNVLLSKHRWIYRKWMMISHISWTANSCNLNHWDFFITFWIQSSFYCFHFTLSRMLDVGWSLCSSNKTLHKNKCTTHTDTHTQTHTLKIIENLCLNRLNYCYLRDLTSQTIYCWRISLSSVSFRFYLNILRQDHCTWRYHPNWSVDFLLSISLKYIANEKTTSSFRNTKMCRMAKNNKQENVQNMKFRAKQFEIGGYFGNFEL